MIYDISIVGSVKPLFYGSIHVFSVCMFQINFLSDNKRGKLETKLSFYTHYSAHGNLITLYLTSNIFFIIQMIIILPSQISTILFSNIKSLLYCHTTWISYCHITLISYCHLILLSYCHHIIILPYQIIFILPNQIFIIYRHIIPLLYIYIIALFSLFSNISRSGPQKTIY